MTSLSSGLATGAKKTVATPCAEYTAMEAHRLLPRTLMGGTIAMRTAGEKYLPKELGESAQAYRIRLSRTPLFNAFRKTVKDMAGKVFAKPVEIGDDVPEKLKGYVDNIDLAGRSLTNFAYDVFCDALTNGISYIMPDMPAKIRPDATLKDDIEQGRRPYLCHVKAQDLIGWKSEVIGGKETLTQVRIAEKAKVEGEFEDEDVDQIRVIEPGSVRLYRQDAKNRQQWNLHEEIATDTDDVQLAPVYFNRTGFMLAEPPLADLADLNVAHWQSQSDQRNIVHVVRVPILFGAGIDTPADGKAQIISANTLFRASSPDARLEYVKGSHEAVDVGRQDLVDLEANLQVMGLQLLVSKPGQTATGEVRDDVKENSPLAMMATSLEAGLNAAFEMMAEMDGLGENAGGTLTVNKDFGISTRDQSDLNLLLAAYSSMAIQRVTFLKELQRRGVLTEDLDPDEEHAALPALPILDGSPKSGSEGVKSGEAAAGVKTA